MDFRQNAFDSSLHLSGVATTLRRIFRPRFDSCEPIEAALAAMASREIVASDIAAMPLCEMVR